MSGHRRKWMISLLACSTLLASFASAADAPRCYVASPDIYRVIAQDSRSKTVLATWKPGQRDAWHSHPNRAEYFLTDCDFRIYTPEGNYRDRFRKEGFGYREGPVESHSFENRGKLRVPHAHSGVGAISIATSAAVGIDGAAPIRCTQMEAAALA
jgi:hypothetical protein